MEFINKIKNYVVLHKRNILIVVGLLVIAFSFILSIASDSTKTNEKPKITPVPTVSESLINKPKDTGYNPLISNEEVENVEKVNRDRLEKLGKKVAPKVEYKFNYRLSSTNKLNSIYNIFSAYAESCNVNTAPSVVPVYTLKSHLYVPEAKDIAKEFDMNMEPASFPTEDSTFQYAFIDTVGLRSLKMTEASGVYDYHKVINPNDEPDSMPNITLQEAITKASSELEKHKLLGEMLAPDGTTKERYEIKYYKNYSGLKITDKSMVTALAMTGSPCDIKSSNNMGWVEAIYTKKGNLYKFINNTRKIDKTFMFSRQSFEASFNEYKDNPGLIKMVIGVPPSSTDEVVLDQNNIQVIWFDYTEKFAQISYVPMYLVSGTIPGVNDVRVFTLFPAIAKKDLDKTNIDELTNGKSTLQLKTFKPKPPKPAVTVPPYAGGCPGNAIDVSVSCTSKTGEAVCSKFIEVPVDKAPDEYKKTCDSGCLNDSGSVEVNTNEDPCKKYMQQLNFPDYPDTDYNGPSGPMNCSINSCPC